MNRVVLNKSYYQNFINQNAWTCIKMMHYKYLTKISLMFKLNEMKIFQEIYMI